MDELIKTFHIEANLILAQVVNFAIVLLVLYKFAYRPILKMLNERTEKIEKGIKDSESAIKRLENASQEEKEILAKAKTEARLILQKNEEMAKKNQVEILAEAKSQAEKILSQAKTQLETEKEKMISEVKEQISDLVVSATEKILHEKIDAEKDKELIEQAIK